ncbi:hypothetical protein I551_8916 [Mycobacterium ulcerans str. Harvey]|uniref:Uncharacterized protein n=1 Tax=Mycobacterium ulcerans str. Harvey TaxID=1299332 RepID=A0ABN0R9P9_MYCUL|nr:hypothetical protein I551_8916 [Mycobacterium ulcerans str. Harvey]
MSTWFATRRGWGSHVDTDDPVGQRRDIAPRWHANPVPQRPSRASVARCLLQCRCHFLFSVGTRILDDLTTLGPALWR